jgi:hypothetical protein
MRMHTCVNHELRITSLRCPENVCRLYGAARTTVASTAAVAISAYSNSTMLSRSGFGSKIAAVFFVSLSACLNCVEVATFKCNSRARATTKEAAGAQHRYRSSETHHDLLTSKRVLRRRG